MLSGQMQLILKKNDSAETVVKHISIGHVINPDNNDDASQEHALRLSSALLNVDSEFLSFDRSMSTGDYKINFYEGDYSKILRGEDTESDENNRLKILRSLNNFENEDDVLLGQAAQKTFIKYFPKDTKIVKQGLANRYIYWILSGEVQVDRTTPFIAKIDARYPIRYTILSI